MPGTASGQATASSYQATKWRLSLTGCTSGNGHLQARAPGADMARDSPVLPLACSPSCSRRPLVTASPTPHGTIWRTHAQKILTTGGDMLPGSAGSAMPSGTRARPR
jgi:hypothetical protein